MSRAEAASGAARAKLLWDELAHLEERRGKGVFSATHTWTYYGSHSTSCESAFVRLLNQRAWIPDQSGQLQRPELVLFETLGWNANPFLLSKIHFKPPAIERLAEEAGIESGVLELLKNLGLTNVAGLKARLGVAGAQDESSVAIETPVDAVRAMLGDAAAPSPPVQDAAGPEPAGRGRTSPNNTSSTGPVTVPSDKQSRETINSSGNRGQTAPGPPGSAGAQFISYVAVGPDDEDPDPDGLDHASRMSLEEKAINLILSREPAWERTPTHNPGYDLIERSSDGTASRWCEVKAMTGDLAQRPVGLTATQFDHARARGSAFWLYVVEHAGGQDPRIVRIQNPAGNARTFTFDHGWLSIADVAQDQES
jgi:hypothetical protein